MARLICSQPPIEPVIPVKYMQLELTDSSLECDILELRNALGNNCKIVAKSTYIFLEFLPQGGTLRKIMQASLEGYENLHKIEYEYSSGSANHIYFKH